MRWGPRSIRQKLTLWYMGILALSLLFFAGVLYATNAVNLLREMDKALVLEASGLADSLAAFRDAEKRDEAASSNWLTAPSPLLSALEMRGQLPTLLKRWAKTTGTLNTHRIIRFVDRYGRTLMASAGYEESGSALPKTGAERVFAGETLHHTLRLNGRRMRAVVRPVVAESGRVIYAVEIVAPMDQLDEALRERRLWMLWLIPVILMLAGVGGWFLASRALHPVDRMIGQAREIGAGALDKRIDVPATDDEMTRLAVTFNEMLARIEQTFRRLRQFSGAASHELRTPLTVMKGELEVALRKPRTPEEYQRVLRTHLDAVQDMTHIVTELLTLARSQAADQVVDWQQVDLSRLIQEELPVWNKLAGGKEVRIELIQNGPVWVRGEMLLLKRLLANLLENAVRHTPPQGSVTVRTERWKDKACLVVQDTGPGIPPDRMAALFDQFFTRKVSDEGSGSSGLGLGLCRWIAEVHRGHIEAASPPGQGAALIVWLPLSV